MGTTSFFTKSLRIKAIIAALVPSVLVLVVVAVIGLYVYERLTRDIVEQRDTELAMITAARLSEGLDQHSQILQTTANDEDVQSLEPARMRQALERVQSRLFVFDAGVVIYNDEGVAVWSDPFSFERRGKGIPVPSAFDQVRRAERPHFSDVFKDSHSGQNAILLAVPVVASGGEFKGVVAGISTLSSLLSDATYSAVLQITASGEGFAYLVDGNGRAIYHRDSSQLGRDLSDTTPVIQVRLREPGAVITKDSVGEKVISGFALVPGTSWGVITQEEWSNVVGPIQDYGKLLVALLALGGVLSGGFIFLAIGRVLQPIKDLTQGAQRIAGGDFGHTIAATTGDEIQTLAQQFNTMAGALKESYAGLEQKVADRTAELRESEERYRGLFEDSRDAIFVSAQGVVVAVNQAALELFGFTWDEAIGSNVGDRYADPDDRGRFRREIERTGSVRDFEVKLLKGDGTVMDCLLTATQRLSEGGGPLGEVQGLLRDVTERKKAEQALRESEERFRRLVEDAADGFFVMEPEGKIVDINQTAGRQFGFSREELLTLSLPDIYATLNETGAADLYERVRPGGPVTLEGLGRRKDGSTFPFEMRSGLMELAGRQHMFALVRDITERKGAEETLVQQMREMAVLEERNRMAREIHDTLAQGFTGIVLQLEAADQVLEGHTGEATGHLNRAKGLARESLQEARRSVWGLVPHALEGATLEEALRERVQQINATGPEKVSFSLSGQPRTLPTDVQAGILRICQESLANITRHAKAGEVKVTLGFDQAGVCLQVQDDGTGFDIDAVKGMDRGGGFGLVSMEQRVRLLGGSFTVKRREGRGTLVEVHVPAQ